MKACSIFALLFLAACGRDAVKHLLDETRAPTRIIIDIRLEETAMPSDKDIQLRHSIANEIEHRQIGIVVRSTADVGRMDLAVDVKDNATAIPDIHQVLRKFGVDDRTTVRVDDEH